MNRGAVSCRGSPPAAGASGVGPSFCSVRFDRPAPRRKGTLRASVPPCPRSPAAVPCTAPLGPVGDGADFVDIVTFDKLAATCAEWLTKGREVAVVGRLRLSERTGRDGERRSKIQVVADAVQVLGAPTKAAGPDGGVAEPAEKPAVGAYRRKAS